MSIPYKPHDYQRRAIRFLLQHQAAGLLVDPGLGKTSVCLATFKVLRQEGFVQRALVIAPRRVMSSVWTGPNGEPTKWQDFEEIEAVALHGPKKRDELDRVLNRRWTGIAVVNPEGLPWLLQNIPRGEWPFQWLIVDESSRFKHTNTKRFKLLRPLLPMFMRRTILTGTPAPNGLLDLFGQAFIMDLGNALGRYITHYRLKYFDQTGDGGFTWVPKPGAEDLIYKALRPLVLRLAGEDYLKLPPYVSNVVSIELPEDAREAYDQMEALLLAEVDGELVTAANSAVASTKCRQVANGGIYLDLRRETFKNLHDAKTEAVVDLVEELEGKPAFVAYEYQHDLARLQAAFPGAPHLGKGISTKQQQQIETDWNAGKIPVLLAQPQSAAHGLNLQGVGSAVVWHSLTWNLEDYQQLIRRVWRQGQRGRVVVHHLVAKNTVDEVMMSVLRAKAKTQDALLGALKQYARSRSRIAA